MGFKDDKDKDMVIDEDMVIDGFIDNIFKKIQEEVEKEEKPSLYELSIDIGYFYKTGLECLIKKKELDLVAFLKICNSLELNPNAFFPLPLAFPSPLRVKEPQIKAKEVVEEIRLHAKKKEITIKELSLEIGYKNENQLGSLLSATMNLTSQSRPISMRKIFKIAKVLDVDISVLFI